MIELYTGTPGSGKSLHCAKEIYTRICRGKNVIANFDINQSIFKGKRRGTFTYYDNSELSPDLLMKYAVTKHKRNTNGHISEGQTLLVIDECQILFNSRDWQAKDRMGWATFFTQHRKYGFNIILITQFDRLIDRQIRSLVEYQVIHRKASNFKTIGFFLGLLFKGNIFVAVTQWYGVKERVNSEFFVMRPKYARLYDSYKIFGAQSAGGVGGPAKDCAAETVMSDVQSRSALMRKLHSLIHVVKTEMLNLRKSLPKLKSKQNKISSAEKPHFE
ncbi:MAG: zonular occludens toxin domain-containing protein, partial [Acinetobacter sp.]